MPRFAVTLLLLLSCSKGTDQRTGLTREPLLVSTVDVDSPLTGPTLPLEQFRAQWDGQRYVVYLTDAQGGTCLTLLPDGTLERTIFDAGTPYSSVAAMALDDAGASHVLVSHGGALSWLRLGRSCGGPIVSTPLDLNLTQLGYGSLGFAASGPDSFTLIGVERVDGGPSHLRYRRLFTDGGLVVDAEGRDADWYASSCTDTLCVSASQRNVLNGNPLSVDFYDPTSHALSSAQLTKDPNYQSQPMVALGPLGVAVASGGATAGDQYFARRFKLSGQPLDSSDQLLGVGTVLTASPSGYVLVTYSSAGLLVSEWLASGPTTPVPLFPELDGGALGSLDPANTAILYGGTFPLAVAHQRVLEGSVYARALTPAFAPNGPLQLLVPRVNEQFDPAFVSTPTSGLGYASWTDSRGAQLHAFVRSFDAAGRPLSSSIELASFPNLVVKSVAWGDQALVYVSDTVNQERASLISGDGGLSPVPGYTGTRSAASELSLAAGSTFATIFAKRYHSPSDVVEGTRVLADGGSDLVLVTPSGAFFDLFAAADDTSIYLAVPQLGPPTALYRLDETGPLVPVGSTPTLGVQAMVGLSSGFCLLTTAGAECHAPDGTPAMSASWPAIGAPVQGAFDGTNLVACVGPTAWYSLAPDGGLTLLPLREPCGPFGITGPGTLTIAESVQRSTPAGTVSRAVLAQVDLFGDAGVDAGSQSDAGTDAGQDVDAGTALDALDAGSSADRVTPWRLTVGPSCRAAGGGSSAGLWALAAWAARRRRPGAGQPQPACQRDEP